MFRLRTILLSLGVVSVLATPVAAEPPDPVWMTPAAVREIDRAVVFVQAVQLSRIEDAARQVLEDTAMFVKAVTPKTPAVVARAAPRATAGAAGSSPAGGGGPITQDQFAALAICEHGGTNGALYGYYSIMDTRAGSLSMAEQQAWAQQIYRDHGAGAWSGCAYTLR